MKDVALIVSEQKSTLNFFLSEEICQLFQINMCERQKSQVFIIYLTYYKSYKVSTESFFLHCATATTPSATSALKTWTFNAHVTEGRSASEEEKRILVSILP